MTPHESLMRLALEEAGAAFREGEVPVGAVVARNGEIIASGSPQVISSDERVIKAYLGEDYDVADDQ